MNARTSKKPKNILERVRNFRGGGTTDYAKKALQNFKILLTQDGLFADIQKFRNKWNIPVKIDQIITEVRFNEVKTEVLDFEDFNNPSLTKLFTEDFLEDFEREKQHPKTDDDIKREDEIFNDLDRLMNKYSVHTKYLEIFNSFIYTGQINIEFFESLHRNGSYFFETVDVNGDPMMAIAIFEETTIKDIQAEWAEIELYRDKFMGYNLPKFTERKNINRDLRIIQLKSSGYKPKDITAIVNREFKSNLTYYEINKVIYELKNIRENKKLILP